MRKESQESGLIDCRLEFIQIATGNHWRVASRGATALEEILSGGRDSLTTSQGGVSVSYGCVTNYPQT